MASIEITVLGYIIFNKANNNLSGGLKHLAPFAHLSIVGLTDCKLCDDDVKDLVGISWDNL